MRVMKYADGAPTLASGANIGAFNVGNALGAWLGGVTITAGLGYTSPIWAGAGITLLGLAVMAFAAAKAHAPPDCGSAPRSRTSAPRRSRGSVGPHQSRTAVRCTSQPQQQEEPTEHQPARTP